MSDAQKIVAEVLRGHEYDGAESSPEGVRLEFCACDPESPVPEPSHIAHVAAEVDKALGGPKREYCARHHSGGGALGFTTKSEALRHIADHPPVPGGVERPPDPGYSGVESRWTSSWEVAE
ncbi:hypothetical protein [Mycobacteroides chelonae]|uniref:hypothetical protein n=1 Tax=Mycobacteroides chelonae TaxID=1774 RepID=UPI001041E527|nr:hypothetical protein [Mycobacteroides chelonae]